MKNYHGIIFAYSAAPELRDLVNARTAASLPFCGRYRLIDFSLSALRNAGILDVGVVMQRDYQSLLDHIGSGKAWDMSRRAGGLRMLPPFGLPEYHNGEYNGTIEALNAVAPYIRDIPQKNVVLMLGNLCANIDLDAAIRSFEASGADITAVCGKVCPEEGMNNCYVLGDDGFVKEHLYTAENEGAPSLQCYIIRRSVLLELMDMCRARGLYRFHENAINAFLTEGGKMSVYIHEGYAATIRTVDAYYKASMDMLCRENRRMLFPADRPVRTKNHEEVSTYYGEKALCKNSLVADNCIIEGDIEDCIVFSGARIAPGAQLRHCIIMRGCVIGEGAQLDCVIADKYSKFSAGTVLVGSPKLPMVVPKNAKI